jgi:hypothetical protein
MLCSDTNGKLPAIHVPNETFGLAHRILDMIDKIKKIGGEGDVEVSMRMSPDGHVHSTKYSFVESKSRAKKSA